MRLIITIGLIFITAHFYACSCISNDTISYKNLDHYDFIAEVEFLSQHYETSVLINKEDSYPAVIDSFRIIRSFVGNLNIDDEIVIHQFGIGCAHKFYNEFAGLKYIIGFNKENGSSRLGMNKFYQAFLCSFRISQSNESEYVLAIEGLKKMYPDKSNYITIILMLSLFILLLIFIANNKN